MPAKRPQPKPAKGKKATPRSAARKPAARKPAEHAKAAAHVRKTVTPTPKKAPAHRTAATASPASTARKAPPEAARKLVDAAAVAAEPAKPVAKPAAAPSRPSPAKSSAPIRNAKPAASAADGEEPDSGEPGSLLAGPRNVQPYIAKRGEQYMGKTQLEHFRQILTSWKQDLMVEVDRTVTHMKDEAANFPDPNDRATQEEEFSLELRTRDRERKLIRKIDEAIKRIEDGSYGYCLETGEEIGIKRLEARPVATLSIEAQERRERRERQYGERDDRYR